jgi:hypothetical protein
MLKAGLGERTSSPGVRPMRLGNGVFVAQRGLKHGGIVAGKRDAEGRGARTRQGMLGIRRPGCRVGEPALRCADCLWGRFRGALRRRESPSVRSSRIAAMPWPMRSAPSISMASRWIPARRFRRRGPGDACPGWPRNHRPGEIRRRKPKFIAAHAEGDDVRPRSVAAWRRLPWPGRGPTGARVENIFHAHAGNLSRGVAKSGEIGGGILIARNITPAESVISAYKIFCRCERFGGALAIRA